MAIADPALALQKAVLAKLNADAALTALVGGRIYDGVPQNAVKPYVSFGPFQILPAFGDCLDGAEATFQLDGWSAKGGATVEAKQLGAAIAAALDETALTLDAPQTLLHLHLSQTRYLKEADGITAHAALTFIALTEPRD